VRRGTAPAQLGAGIYSTGEIAGSQPEQALVIETSKGLVMLVSCAHPGIAKMVETVEKQRNTKSIRMIVGGLHMYEQSEQQIRPVVAQLQKLNVQSVVLAIALGSSRCGSSGGVWRSVCDGWGGEEDSGGVTIRKPTPYGRGSVLE